MKKTRDNTRLTRQNLLNAFWSIYQVKRIEKITVKEITSTAGYNRSTFYEYFKDVYDVLQQLEEELLVFIQHEIVNELDMFNNEAVIERIIHLFEQKGEYLTFLFSSNGDPAFIEKFKNTLKPAMFKALPIDEHNRYTPFIFEYVISASISTISYWYTIQKDISLTELITLIRNLHANGSLLTMKAYNISI